MSGSVRLPLRRQATIPSYQVSRFCLCRLQPGATFLPPPSSFRAPRSALLVLRSSPLVMGLSSEYHHFNLAIILPRLPSTDANAVCESSPSGLGGGWVSGGRGGGGWY